MHLLEQRRLLQNVGKNDVADAAAANKHVLQFRELSVARPHRHARELAVHVILRPHQVASVLLSIRQLDDHGVALALVEQLNRNAHRHEIVCLVLFQELNRSTNRRDFPQKQSTPILACSTKRGVVYRRNGGGPKGNGSGNELVVRATAFR